MAASMKDVASLAGVSTATVSHVINRTRNVKPETYRRVMNAISELQYSVNPVARNLRNGRSRIIGYMVSNLANYFYIEISRKMEEILYAAGYSVIHLNTDEDPVKEKESLQNLVLQNVDGLIIVPVSNDWTELEDIVGDRCPCVFIDRKPENCLHDSVLSTNYEGAYECTRILLNRGHERVGFLASRKDTTMDERLNGYLQALRDTGRKTDERLVKTGSGRPMITREMQKGESYNLMKELYEVEKIKALFIGNDLFALGAFNYVIDKGLRIPEDIDIVTFDNPFWLSMLDTRIPAMRQDFESMGKAAAEIMLKKLNGADHEIKEYRIKTRLVI